MICLHSLFFSCFYAHLEESAHFLFSNKPVLVVLYSYSSDSSLPVTSSGDPSMTVVSPMSAYHSRWVQGGRCFSQLAILSGPYNRRWRGCVRNWSCLLIFQAFLLCIITFFKHAEATPDTLTHEHVSISFKKRIFAMMMNKLVHQKQGKATLTFFQNLILKKQVFGTIILLIQIPVLSAWWPRLHTQNTPGNRRPRVCWSAVKWPGLEPWPEVVLHTWWLAHFICLILMSMLQVWLTNAGWYTGTAPTLVTVAMYLPPGTYSLYHTNPVITFLLHMYGTSTHESYSYESG